MTSFLFSNPTTNPLEYKLATKRMRWHGYASRMQKEIIQIRFEHKNKRKIPERETEIKMGKYIRKDDTQREERKKGEEKRK
jgi:hypothetical protein